MVFIVGWAADELDGTHRQVYLVTFPHPKGTHAQCGTKLVAPGPMSKRQVQVYSVSFPHPKGTHAQCGTKWVVPGPVSKRQVLECVWRGGRSGGRVGTTTGSI